MTKDEALKMIDLILDDKNHYPDEDIPILVMDALQACKEALEQPAPVAQEPYCWLGYGMQAHDEKPFEGATPLYKHPAPTIKENLTVRKPLNDENAMRLVERIETELGRHIPYAFNILRAVEKAHGIGVENEQTN